MSKNLMIGAKLHCIGANAKLRRNGAKRSDRLERQVIFCFERTK
jgi:hypothetical protein